MRESLSFALCLAAAACGTVKEKICAAPAVVAPSGPIATHTSDEEAASQPQPEHETPQLYSRLRERRMALEAKELALAERERAFENKQKASKVAAAESASTEDPIVAILASMQPKAAARMLDSMPEPDVARALLGMETSRVSALLSTMEPARAARVSLQLSKSKRKRSDP